MKNTRVISGLAALIALASFIMIPVMTGASPDTLKPDVPGERPEIKKISSNLVMIELKGDKAVRGWILKEEKTKYEVMLEKSRKVINIKKADVISIIPLTETSINRIDLDIKPKNSREGPVIIDTDFIFPEHNCE